MKKLIIILLSVSLQTGLLWASGRSEVPEIEIKSDISIAYVVSSETESLENLLLRYQELFSSEVKLIPLEWKQLKNISEVDADLLILGSRYYSKEINGVAAFMDKILDKVSSEGMNLLILNNFISFPDGGAPKSWLDVKLTAVTTFHSDAVPLLPMRKITAKIDPQLEIPAFDSLKPDSTPFDEYSIHSLATTEVVPGIDISKALNGSANEAPAALAGFGWYKLPEYSDWETVITGQNGKGEIVPVHIQKRWGPGTVALSSLFLDEQASLISGGWADYIFSVFINYYSKTLGEKMNLNNENTMKLNAQDFTRIAIDDCFWTGITKTVKETTIPACLERCEESGRLENFRRAASGLSGGFQGRFFNDSDVYKVLEGAAYSLSLKPDAELEKRCDEIIESIAGAQEADGYIMTYYTLEQPSQKWTDMDKHEMYCIGHLIEAGIAYKKATGKNLLLETSIKAADLLIRKFGPGGDVWVPGHEEIELALFKLADETGNTDYATLALRLLSMRGRGYGRGLSWNMPEWGASYSQDRVPVEQQDRVEGHAVRAMYLYTAMSDSLTFEMRNDYSEALERLWKNLIDKNYYLTGGIGPSGDNEGFVEDYHLPSQSAYCETCASAGLFFWASNMLKLSRQGRYGDVMERELYNGLLSGLSLSGDRFFYENPLESVGNHHRSLWYKVSCCPTQLARFIPSIGGHAYYTGPKEIFVNLYIAGTARLKLENGFAVLRQEHEYPWEGRICISIDEIEGSLEMLYLRLPGWVRDYRLKLPESGEFKNELNEGFLVIEGEFKAGQQLILELDMPLMQVVANEKVKQLRNKTAFQRGPIVYCFEEVDNPDFNILSLTKSLRWTLYELDFTTQLMAFGIRINSGDEDLYAIPYFLWDNRAPGRMSVWIPADSLPVESSHKAESEIYSYFILKNS